jgi:hypothetical protein
MPFAYCSVITQTFFPRGSRLSYTDTDIGYRQCVVPRSNRATVDAQPLRCHGEPIPQNTRGGGGFLNLNVVYDALSLPKPSDS